MKHSAGNSSRHAEHLARATVDTWNTNTFHKQHQWCRSIVCVISVFPFLHRPCRYLLSQVQSLGCMHCVLCLFFVTRGVCPPGGASVRCCVCSCARVPRMLALSSPLQFLYSSTRVDRLPTPASVVDLRAMIIYIQNTTCPALLHGIAGKSR